MSALTTWRRGALALATTASLLLAGLTSPAAQAATGLEGFDPGNIISDGSFFNPSTMTTDEVSAFIATMGAGCVPGPDGTPCLKDHLSDIPERPKTSYCEPVAAKAGATAAEVVIAAAQACEINPQVLLVLLQKEQALVTGSGDLLYADRYAKATGLGCPDFQRCDPARATFFGQVYGAAERFQIYRQHPDNYRHKKEAVNTVAFNPEPLCGTAQFVIKNQATAGLYNYTPYVPNAAALAAVTAEGDLCSAYGNRNFYRYMKTWFPGSVSTSDAAPVQAKPGSTLRPEMTAIYSRAAELGFGALGGATSAITCKDGTCTKQYAKATLTWTAKDGVVVSGRSSRISGATRFDTAVAASRVGFPAGASTVFVATGSNYADALAAGPWALREGSPILLSPPAVLPSAVHDELRRLRPKRVVVIGGTSAVSDSVMAAIGKAATGARVERVHGSTRYDTALEISRTAFRQATVAHVASGRDFADALVGGPLSGGAGPILLVPGEGAPSTDTVEELRRLQVDRILVLGGTARITATMESALGSVAPTERIAGQDRYETAALVAARSGSAAGGVAYVASGESYPDALVSTGLQVTAPGTLLLSRRECLPSATAAFLRKRSDARITLIGGTGALGDEVAALIACSG